MMKKNIDIIKNLQNFDFEKVNFNIPYWVKPIIYKINN